MKKKIVVTVISLLVVMTIAWLLNEWLFNDIAVWKDTPARHLAVAVMHQNTRQIAKIVKAHPELLNYQEPRGGATLLIWAVGIEKYKSAEALLQCGADPNIATTDAGETALYVAAGYSWVDTQAKEDPKYVKLLLRYGANPNINYISFKPIGSTRDGTESGTSPLMHSIRCGIEKTKALVEGGADINYKTPSGRTAAIEALMAGSFNASDEQMEYAYYIIVEKKANITDPYYADERFTRPGDDYSKVKHYPVNDLRDWNPSVNSKGYQMKMAIVKEFARQGVDYYKID